jgi:hypothetical protein
VNHPNVLEALAGALASAVVLLDKLQPDPNLDEVSGELVRRLQSLAGIVAGPDEGSSSDVAAGRRLQDLTGRRSALRLGLLISLLHVEAELKALTPTPEAR